MKRRYSLPRIVDYGTVAAITLGSPGDDDDDNDDVA
jgi:hypothetical protein